MNNDVAQLLKNLEAHADAIMRVPSNEQHIGNIQAITSVAILDVKRCLVLLAMNQYPWTKESAWSEMSSDENS